MDIHKGKFPSTTTLFLTLFLLSFILHFSFLNKDLMGVHVWRQTQTQTGIENFIQEGNSILNPTLNSNPETDRIVRLEFPLMQWTFAQIEKDSQNPVLISRFLSFLIAALSSLGMFFLAFQMGMNRILSFCSAWLFSFSPLIFYYAINPLPDNLALCLGIFGLAFFFSYIRSENLAFLLLSSLFFGISVLVKLPYLINLSLPLFYFLNQGLSGKLTFPKMSFLWIVVSLFQVFPFLWYSWVIPQWGPSGVVEGIFASDKNAQFYLKVLQDVLISTLPELIINYAALPLFLAGLTIIVIKRKHVLHQYSHLIFWGLILIAYFIYDSPIIANVHDYYLFPFVPALVLISVFGISQLLKSEKKLLPYLILFCLLLMPFTAFLRVSGRYNEKSPGFNPLILENKTALRQLGNTNERWIVGADRSGGVIYLYYLQRKGWSYDKELDSNRLKQLIQFKAKYILTDNSIDTCSQIKPFLGPLCWEKNELKVYLLKPYAGR